MKFSEWKKYLCSWVNQCKFHEQPATSLEDADPDKFFANYLALIRARASSSDELPKTMNDSLPKFLLENWPKFKFFMNEDGSIKRTDYVFVYSILLYDACLRKSCVQLKLDSRVEQHCFSQFLEKMANTKVLTRQALHMIILEISEEEEEVAKNNDIVSVIDDGKTVEVATYNDPISIKVEKVATNNDPISIIDDTKTDELEIMASAPNSPEDSDDDSEKSIHTYITVKLKSDQLSDDGQHSMKDDGQISIIYDSKLTVKHGSTLSSSEDSKLLISDNRKVLNSDRDSKVPIYDDSKVSINDDSKVPTKDDSKVLINDDDQFLINDDSELSMANDSKSSLPGSLASASSTFESFDDDAEEWENLDDRTMVECQFDDLELRFDLAKERLSKGIRSANLLGKSLKRATTLFSCCSHKVTHLLPIIRASRPSSDSSTEPGGYVLSRLLILMQKHRMQVPQFNQMESIYTQILTVIDYNLSQSCSGNNLQKDGQQTLKLRRLTRRNESLQKRLAEMTTMQKMLKGNAQCSKMGLVRKVVVIGINAHTMLIKNLKVELGLKLIVKKKSGARIDQILICELKALIKSKDLLIEELAAKHGQFLDNIKMKFGMIINLSNTEPNVAVQILEKIEAERNRLLQKLKINFNLNFNQFDNLETSEDYMIEELKELVEKKLEKRSLRKTHMRINNELEFLKGSLQHFSDTMALAKLQSYKDEDTLKAMEQALNAILSNHQDLEKVIKSSAEEIANLCSASGDGRDREIIELSTQVDVQRKAAIDLLKTIKGTDQKKIDEDSDFSFKELHSQLKSFCMRYKHSASKRKYLDKRAKLLAKQLSTKSVSRGQLTSSCWNQLDGLLNDLLASYDQVVSQLLAARGELNRYSQASCDYSECIDKLREEFTIQVNISAVQQLQDLMMNPTAQGHGNDMISQQLVIKQLQLQLSRQRRDRKRLKSQLITCRRQSSRSLAKWRQLKQKLKTANEPKVTKQFKQGTRGQLDHGKFEKIRLEQQLSLRDGYIKKLVDSRQMLQKQLMTKVRRIEKLRHQNEMMLCKFNHPADTDGEAYASNLSEQSEKEIVMDFLQQDNLELQHDFKKSLEEMETSFILSLKYELEESQSLLATAQQEVKELRADLEHLKLGQLNGLDNDEQRQSKNVAAVSPSASRRPSQIPLKYRSSKGKGSSKGDKGRKSNGTTTTATPQPSKIQLNTPQQVSEYYTLHDSARSRAVQREHQLYAAQTHKKERNQNQEVAETQHQLSDELWHHQKWQSIKYLKTHRRNKQLREKLKKLKSKVFVAKRVQCHWGSENDGSSLCKDLEELQLENESLRSDLKKKQNKLYKYKTSNHDLHNLINSLQSQLEAKEKENYQLGKNLKGSQILVNNLESELDRMQRLCENLQTERDQLQSQLAKAPHDTSDYYKLEKVNSELLSTLNLRKSKLLSLTDEFHNLQADYKESQAKCKQLELELASRDKELEEVKRSKEGKGDYPKPQESNDELLNALEAQKKRLEKLESEKKALQEELNEAKDMQWNYNHLEEANRELVRISDTKDNRLEQLKKERNELYARLKQSEEWQCDLLHSRDSTTELQEKRLENLECERKDLLEKLKQTEEWKRDYLHSKDSTTELQEKRLENLECERKDLLERLKQAEMWKSDFLQIKDSTTELQEKRLENLESERKDLLEKLKQSEEWKRDYLQSKSATSELQIAFNAQEKRLENLESERKDLLEKLKQSEEWKRDYLQSENATSELQNAFNAQEKRLEELESERNSLLEKIQKEEELKCNVMNFENSTGSLERQLKEQGTILDQMGVETTHVHQEIQGVKQPDWHCDFLEIKKANDELLIALAAKEEDLQKLEKEKTALYEELQQASGRKTEYLKLKNANSELQRDLDAKERSRKRLETANKALNEELKRTEDMRCDYQMLKDAKHELKKAMNAKEEELQKLKNEKSALSEELKQASGRKSDFLQLKEDNSELKIALDAKEKRLKKLEMKYQALCVEQQQTEEWKCDYLKLKDSNSELQNAFNAQVKLVENLNNEKQELNEEVKSLGEWKCNYYNLKEANGELLSSLEVFEKRYAKLENEKKKLCDELRQSEKWQSDCLQLKEDCNELHMEKQHLREKLKQAQEWRSKNLQLKEANMELHNKLDAQEELLEKSEQRNETLQEKLKQAAKWQCEYLKLKDAKNVLQNELDDQDKLIEEMNIERTELYDKLKQTEEWWADSKDAISQLQDALNAQDERIEEIENEKKTLEGKLRQAEDWKCNNLKLKEANNDLQNALDSRQRLLKELQNENRVLQEVVEETEALKVDYLKLKEANDELKYTLEAQEKRYERLQKKFEYSQSKQKHYRQKYQDLQKMDVCKTELESARRSQEQLLKMVQEENDEQAKESETQNLEQKVRQRDAKIQELESTLAKTKKQLQLLQTEKLKWEISKPLLELENQSNTTPTADQESSNLQLRQVIELQERIKTLETENNELSSKLGQCEKNVLELEKQNAAINYRMRKLDGSMKNEKTIELQNKQKDLEEENSWLNLEIGRLNAIVSNRERLEGSYSLPLACSSAYSMPELDDNSNRSRNRSLYRDKQTQVEPEDRT